jgi:hypothetical protein
MDDKNVNKYLIDGKNITNSEITPNPVNDLATL